MFLYYYDFDMCGYSVELVERTNDVIVRVEILKYGTSMHHASMCDLPLQVSHAYFFLHITHYTLHIDSKVRLAVANFLTEQ